VVVEARLTDADAFAESLAPLGVELRLTGGVGRFVVFNGLMRLGRLRLVRGRDEVLSTGGGAGRTERSCVDCSCTASTRAKGYDKHQR
jgi:hypothetical protein